jgi:hypothetical protein
LYWILRRKYPFGNANATGSFSPPPGWDRMARLIQPAPITAKTNTIALAMTGGDPL